MNRKSAIRSAVLALASLFGCGSFSTQAAEDPKPAGAFSDPKPPKAAELKAVDPPPLKPNSDVTFHRKPKRLPQGASTHDWHSFLGPTHNAVSTETKLLAELGDGEPKLVWEMRKGTGYTSPAISGDRLVYFHRAGSEEIIECLHPETGERYWKFEYGTTFEDRYGYNNGPRASPVIDGDRVYTYGAQGKLHCLRLDTGQLIWRRDIAAEFKVPQDFFGTATTPLIDDGRLILQIGAPGGPTVTAFDPATGRMLWGAGSEWGPSYASPVPATVHGRKRIFVLAGGESRPPSGGLLSIDPANGKIDFSFPWRSRSYESVNASNPLVVGNQVLISATYRTGAALLNLKPDGSHEVAWTSDDFDLHWNTPVYHEGYVYGFAGRNEPDAGLMCIDWKTGETVWREVPEWEEEAEFNGQLKKYYASPYRASLLKVDGRFLALGEHGHLMWLELTPKGYKILSRERLFLARETWQTPVLSRGLLYVSQNSPAFTDRSPPRLRCYDLRARQ